MKIEYQVCSDVNIDDPKGEILVLTGDCMKYGKDFFRKCSESYQQTYIVMGNEDFYNGPDVNETLDAFHFKAFGYENVTFMNNASVVVDDKEIFFTTLWKPCYGECDIYDVERRDDYYCVTCNGGNLSVDKETQLHAICSEWLCSALFDSAADHKVVVTHHPLPSDNYLSYCLKMLGAEAFYSH